ncbi:MAG: hypothetical protein AB1896_22300, partial [Thermodesulfobacteriota bacterium]
GINVHRASGSGRTAHVGRYSAGCQVFQSAEDFGAFIGLCEQAAKVWGNRFSYTLLEEKDF